jgi:hypothetical protein
MNIPIAHILILIFFSTIAYGQDKEFKLAGLRMGMSSEEVIALLTNDPQYSLYGYNNSIIKEFVILDKSTEVLSECEGYSLYSNDTKNFLSLIYNGFVMKQPQFRFINNQLVFFSSTVIVDEVYSSIETKYGKPNVKINKYQMSEWNNGETELSIVHPSAFKGYVSGSTKEGLIKLTHLSVIEGCKKQKGKKQADFLNNLIELEEGRISVDDIALGMTKSDCINVLKKKYGNQENKERISYWNDDFQVSDSGSFVPDTISIDEKEHGVNLICKFYDDRIYSIVVCELSCSVSAVSPAYATKHQLILEKKYPAFSKRNIKYDTKIKKRKLIDELVLESEYDKVSIKNIFGSSFGYIECVSKTVLSKLEKDRYDDITRRMRIFISKLDQSEMFNIKIDSPKARFPYATSLGYVGQVIDRNYSNSIHKIEQHNWPDIPPFSHHEYIDNKYKYYCCPISTLEIMSRDDVIISLSGTFIQKVHGDNSKVRAEMRDILISELTSKYGKPDQLEYLDELHYYWIIGKNIFDVTYKSKNDVELSATYNFSFRKLEPNDFLIKSKFKKSIVD